MNGINFVLRWKLTWVNRQQSKYWLIFIVCNEEKYVMKKARVQPLQHQVKIFFPAPAGWCSDAGRYLCDPAIFKKTWFPLMCRYDLALLKSTGSRFDSFCTAVCGTNSLGSHVNGPACETAEDQPHKNKESVYTSKCKSSGLYLPRPTIAAPQVNFGRGEAPSYGQSV